MAAHRIEALKAADPLAWVQRMNSIQAQVREMVNDELICNGSLPLPSSLPPGRLLFRVVFISS